jgi:hypothetical protein
MTAVPRVPPGALLATEASAAARRATRVAMRNTQCNAEYVSASSR